MNAYSTIDEYIALFPPATQELLKKMRALIHEIVPEAQEKISYGIPTFTLYGNLVHFGGFKDHISFFPTSSGIEAFKNELTAYKTARGTVQFPLDRPIPWELIARMVKFRVEESSAKAKKNK